MRQTACFHEAGRFLHLAMALPIRKLSCHRREKQVEKMTLLPLIAIIGN